MSHGFSNKRVFFGIACIVLAAGSATADDVKVQPAAGSGFVVTDQAGATERLRVDEAGGVSLPGLAASASPNNGVCRDATTGQLGTCPVNSNQAAIDVLGYFVKTVQTTRYVVCGYPSRCAVAEGEVYVTATCGESTDGTATSPFYGNRWWAIATTCSEPADVNLTFKLADTYPTYKLIRDPADSTPSVRVFTDSSAAVAFIAPPSLPPPTDPFAPPVPLIRSGKIDMPIVAFRSQFATCLYSGPFGMGAFAMETLTNTTLCIRAGQ